ncbi:hypothetical protein LCGC14_0017480 [marine sediment metagenome]|uniref:DUF2089 domain-containing protein n=1 Tax=marine sediment metagenome TaxID=412755 RepID=A0A0F9W4M2_9ZZZZ|nr:DUF2089 family protein [Phycisphaerae bacterium]HDZ42452.1 DUF2089 family protein [Phycisphaerae bacterium]
MSENDKKQWYNELGSEYMSFIKRFVLASGSLKALAKVYAVSYPTIRLRLDRVIERVKILDEQRDSSPFERELSLLYAEGKMDESTFTTILAAHRRQGEDA